MGRIRLSCDAEGLSQVDVETSGLFEDSSWSQIEIVIDSGIVVFRETGSFERANFNDKRSREFAAFSRHIWKVGKNHTCVLVSNQEGHIVAISIFPPCGDGAYPVIRSKSECGSRITILFAVEN
ncbi:MAG: hypothetical protein R3C11_22045 [Planctomycetaceae bacterium]